MTQQHQHYLKLAGWAILLGFVVVFVMTLVDVFILTPGGAAYWVDAQGNRMPDGYGVPVYRKPFMAKGGYGYVLAAGSLGAFLGGLVLPRNPSE